MKLSVTDLSIRYGFLLIIGINIGMLYLILTPLTVFPSYAAFNELYGAVFYPPDTIAFKGYFAHIVEACVAGSAYYFLMILNLATPMKLTKRLLSLAFLLGTFYILNLGRIVGFGILFTKGFQYFDFTHLSTWYFGSTLLVVGLWFANVAIFKIKTVPVYTDVHRLIGSLKKHD